MKKFLSILMLSVLLLTTCLPAAVAEVDPRSSHFFHSYGIYLYDVGNQQLQIIFSVNALGLASEVGVLQYVVQQETSDGWVNVATAYGTCSYNAFAHTFSHTWNAYAGKTYRVLAVFTCTIDGETGLHKLVSSSTTIH